MRLLLLLTLLLCPAVGNLEAMMMGGTAEGFNDAAIESICALAASSTEARLLEEVRECGAPSNAAGCASATACVTSVVGGLAAAEECGPGELCNRAGTALVLVETLRRLVEASLRGREECGRWTRLRALVAACEPAELEPSSAAYWASLGVDGRGMEGYQRLLRGVGEGLRREESIAADMRAVEAERLWRGAAAIAFSFGCPGLVALVSPSHLGLVVVVEVVGAIVMVLYVWAIHNVWMALAGLGVCLGVGVAQVGLLVLRGKLIPSTAEPEGASTTAKTAVRLSRELDILELDPLEGLAVSAHTDDVFRWDVELEGEGEPVTLRVHFPSDFPSAPPLATVLPPADDPAAPPVRIDHPLFDADWDPQVSIRHILLTLKRIAS